MSSRDNVSNFVSQNVLKTITLLPKERKHLEELVIDSVELFPQAVAAVVDRSRCRDHSPLELDLYEHPLKATSFRLQPSLR